MHDAWIRCKQRSQKMGRERLLPASDCCVLAMSPFSCMEIAVCYDDQSERAVVLPLRLPRPRDSPQTVERGLSEVRTSLYGSMQTEG